MKQLFFILCQYCLMQPACAQLTGKVVTTNQQTIAFANVLLLKATDSSLVKAAITSDRGIYNVDNIPPGKYVLSVSHTGFVTHISTAFEIPGTQKIDHPVSIVLTAASKDLKKVVVRAEKPLYQQKTEGMVVNVESSIMTKGSTALQVLERSPGVAVNHRDNSIELNGKSGVTVMLNGKTMRMSESQLVDLLSGMSADDIASIELLTSPSAKYDAEGSAGIINIVMKKNKTKGTNANASVTAGYGYREKLGTNLNISHNTDKLNLYGSYAFSHNNTYSDMFVDSYQDMPFLGGKIHALGNDTTHVTFNNYTATLGADIKLNARTTIGGSVMYTTNRSSGYTNTYIGYNVLPDSILQYSGTNSGTGVWNNVISSAYIEKTFSPKEKLVMNVDYLYFNTNSPYNVEGVFVDKHGAEVDNGQPLSASRQRGHAETTIKVLVGKADYSKQLNKDVLFETGIKATNTKSGSLSGFESFLNNDWTSDEQTANNIIMKENISAAYISFNSQLNSSTRLVTGLRYEYTITKMNDTKNGHSIVDRKMGTFFPNVSLTKKLNDQSELQVAYTKRITRPSYNDLASYVGYTDPTAVYSGNPFLQPTITHTLKLGYNYKRYNVALVASRDQNGISRYQLSESRDRNALIISPQNIAWQNSLNLQLNFPVKLTKWWTMNYSFNGGPRNYKITYTKEPFTHSYIGYSMNSTQAFTLPEKFSAELSGYYNSRNYNGTQKVGGYPVINFGIKKELGKSSLQLSITDIFTRERYDINYGTLTNEAFDIKNHVVVYPESSKSPIFKLTYALSFGGTAAKEKRNNGSGDEQDRIRKE